MNNKLVSRYKNNIILVKYFLSLLGVSAIAVIVLSFSMYYLFQEKTTAAINNANRLALSNIDTIMTGYLDSARRISMELYQSPEIKSLIMNDGEEWNDNTQKAIGRILSTMSVNTDITSVYVFSKTRIILKPTNRVMPEKYEEAFLDMIKKNKTAQPIPWVLENMSSSKTCILSIFFKEDAGNENSFTGAVMVNMNMNILHNKVFANRFSKQQQIYITDKSGKVLLQNDMDNFGKDISSEIFFGDIIKADNDSSSEKLTINGKDYYLCYIRSANKEIYTFTVMDYGLSIAELTRNRNVIIAICLSILLGIIIVSLIVSYRIYQPIHNIFQNIRNLFSHKVQNQTSMNELQLVSNTIAGIVETLNDYEKEKNKNVIRKFLLQTTSLEKEELEGYLKIMNLSGRIGCSYSIVVFRLCGYKAFIKTNTNRAVDFQMDSIGRIAYEVLSREVICFYFGSVDDHVFMITGEEEYHTGRDLNKLLTEAQEAILSILGLETTVGISDSLFDKERIREKYREAYELTNYRLLYGRRAIIDMSLVSSYSNDQLVRPLIDTALEAVKKGSHQAFIDVLDELLLTFRQLKSPYSTVTETFYELADSILKIPEESGFHNKNNEKFNTVDIVKLVEGMEDYNELKDWLLGIYNELVALMSGINNTGIRDIVSRAVEYISGNYYNQEITANSMAERLSISPSYFSRIFKECIGTSFPEYIINIRLEKAKEILMQNEKVEEIKDICFKVGYNNTSYFTAAFKKKYGITPSKYRLHHISEKEEISNH